ncbi:MAG: hypothetical protein HXX18_10985 [Bacteroidetes bacterium]|nr:hypothetical protein [Bacteroidota bacterium]
MLFDPEFKKALQRLTEPEKDKLILRLLKHDLVLANRLHFELLDTDSVKDKRAQLETSIIKKIERVSERYYSPGYLLMDAREISGDINNHVSITKDKYGEISLNCLLLKKLLELNNNRIETEEYGKAYTLCTYIVAKIFKILLLMQKQHDDLYLDFREDIETIGKFIGNNPNLMKIAIYNGLDVNWLIQFNIPENIYEIYKNLRQNGQLK